MKPFTLLIGTNAPDQPRFLLRLWGLARDGLPSVGRYRRYFAAVAGPVALVWGLAIVYVALAPDRFESRMTLVLPGTGVGGSMNLESIGQASTNTSSAFASSTLSPTESYKRLLMSDLVVGNAAELVGEDISAFPQPAIKLIDQTNLIEVTISSSDPAKARSRMRALKQSFDAALDSLREDEGATREAADASRITELQEKVDLAQEALLDFQAETGLISLDQFAGRITELDRLKAAERDRRVQVAESGASTGRLSATLATSLPQARYAMRLKADPEFRELLQLHARTSAILSEKSATLGSAHETIEELTAEKTFLEREMAKRGRELTGMSEDGVLNFADLAVSDTRESLFASLSERDSRHAGNGAALSELKRQIASQSKVAGTQVEQASKLADLTRDLRVAEAVFSSALAQLDTNKSDIFASYPLVQTLEVPSLPKSKSSPQPLIAIAGAMGATIFILIGFLLLWLRQPIIRKLLPNA